MKNVNPESSKKIKNYLLALFDSDDFNESIAIIRNSYEIKKGGFKSEKEKQSWEENIGWEHNLAISDDINALTKKFNIEFPSSSKFIEKFLYYGKYNDLEKMPDSLCYVSDIIEEKNNPYEMSETAKDRSYPIAIRISPYASRRDIADFIGKIYTTEIKPLQDKYNNKKIRIGKIKTKNNFVKRRNEFIYENRDKPRIEIQKLVKNEFGRTLDYEYISKIISEVKRKRKEV